jgi:hypothetical protein
VARPLARRDFLIGLDAIATLEPFFVREIAAPGGASYSGSEIAAPGGASYS